MRRPRRADGARRPGRSAPGDVGTVALEFAVAFTIWAIGMALLATFYQVTAGADDLAHAAAMTARAAAMANDPADAARIAHTTGTERLAIGPCESGTVAVRTDTTRFGAGGTVQVTVSCRTDTLIGPARNLTATAEEVIDRYRGGI